MIIRSRPDKKGVVRCVDVCSEICPFEALAAGNPYNYGHLVPMIRELKAVPNPDLAKEWLELKDGDRSLRFMQAGAAACAQCATEISYWTE